MSDLSSVAGTIVVGVDGSRSARHALHWTGRWAAFTNTPVTVVAALGKPPVGLEVDGGSGPVSKFREQVRIMVEGEIQRLRAEVPTVDVSYRDEWGDAAQVLIEATRHALGVVLGTRGLGGWAGLLLGTVSDKVISHAKGPVVVVPPHWKPVRRGEPVTLGVDDPATCGPAVSFAVRAAQALGTSLHVIHAWEVQKGWSHLATTFGAAHVRSVREAAEIRLETVCQMLAAQAPDLPVVEQLVEGDPAVVLSEASQGSRLLVMGTRGRGGWQGLLLGSRSRELAQSSACPVAIIRERS